MKKQPEENCDLILRLYQIYVETMEKAVSRRQISNTFFITLNTSLIAITSLIASLKNEINYIAVIVFFTIICGCINCIIWYSIIKNYKRLSSAKFKVIKEIEDNLPVKAFRQEWKYLIGSNKKKYTEFSVFESSIPVVYAFFYISMLCLFIFKI